MRFKGVYSQCDIIWIFTPFSSEGWMMLDGMKELNDLGGYERLQQHLLKTHGVDRKEYAALAPLINSYSKQLLYEVVKDEQRCVHVRIMLHLFKMKFFVVF